MRQPSMKQRKPPLRRCIGCGLSADKRQLLRIVRTGEGDASVDPSGKAHGRGAYLHPRTECFETAAKRKRFGAALQTNLREEDVERLREEFEKELSSRRPSDEDGD